MILPNFPGSREPVELSEYRAMWVMVMFDLPVQSKELRKTAATFRKNLLGDGFWMLQFHGFLIW